MNDDVRDLIASGQSVVRMENETMQALTVARPRPEVTVIIAKAIEELEAVPEFAASNFYVIPYKEKRGDESSKTSNVEGLSIKASMVLLRHFRNAMTGGQIVGEDQRFIYIQGAALDVENNTRVQRPKAVSKWGVSNGREYLLSDRQLDQKVQAEMSKVIRNAVLAIVPEPVKMKYYRRAKEIAANPSLAAGGKGQKVEGLSVRVDKMFSFFWKNYGVDQAKILSYLSDQEGASEKKASSDVTEEDLGTLIGVSNALKDKEATIEDYFGHAKAEAAKGVEQTASALLDNIANGGAEVKTTEGVAADTLKPAAQEAKATEPAQAKTKGITATKQPKKKDVFDDAIERNKAAQATTAQGEPVDPKTGEIFASDGTPNKELSDLFGGVHSTNPEEDLKLKLLEDIRSTFRVAWPKFPDLAAIEPKHAAYISKMISRAWKTDGWERIVDTFTLYSVESGLAQFQEDMNVVLKALKKDPIDLVAVHNGRKPKS